MPEIPESYASPGLRWSLLLHDHPGAKYTAELKKGREIGLPDAYGGGDDLCVVTIVFPDHEKEGPVVGYKPVKPRGNADDWNIAVTKTLGRALKKAGYPDDLVDLKALMHWRQRTKELSALESGSAVAALGSGEEPPTLRALPADAVTGDDDPDSRLVRGDDAPDGGAAGHDDVVDGEVVEDQQAPQAPQAPASAPVAEAPAAPSGHGEAWSNLPDELRARVGALPEREQQQLVSRMDAWGLLGRQPSDQECRKVAAFVKSLEAVAKAPAKAPRPPEVQKPAPQEPSVVEAEAFVEDAMVDQLLDRYEALSPGRVENVDSQAKQLGLTWNYPMPVGTYDRLNAIVSSQEQEAA